MTRRVSMASSGGGDIRKITAAIVGIGLGLHTLHTVADGYEWAADVARRCPWCKFRRDQ
jgi:hypothetical protein